ncbi:hypothetical protein S40285_07444 [Stachybotrys chlorohalonatus IBT 40285]|uniref:Zn(2)-C6 fungal-type domain-containing protein n=1 Tax=Stachybotrys chlorohalonatus (strain IBT 40285) TaxID=1283841 RepID=A0A084QAQ0_STAC4|nr:hypothetical protein S40285_07444 [Stachybotrys chlorohalonata IBT 40285]
MSLVAQNIQDAGHRSGAMAGPRPQLPSLYSILGPGSVARPLASPSTDRPAAYPLPSTLDRPRASPGTAQSAYFAQSNTSSLPTPPQHSPYEKYEPRQPLPSIVRNLTSADTARYPDDHPSLAELRPEANTNPKWWQETSRREHPMGPREPFFRSPHDRYHHPFHGAKEDIDSYPDPRSARGAQNQLPIPTTPVAAEAVHSKDGLGPKIWTGTHFLPRYVRTADVPGEGICYFYDDGSHCKTVIDGEAVNAHWGVTKAGKPRKRLAIACVTCREKKIKCDPDYPRCVQCEKFGRICKFKNAPRGGHNTSPTLGPHELDDTAVNALAGEGELSPLSPQASPQDSTGEPLSHKRQKIGLDDYAHGHEPIEAPALDHSKSLPAAQALPKELSRAIHEGADSACMADPSLIDGRSTLALVSKFFDHVDSTMILCFVPELLFKDWVSSCKAKSAEDLMLLYSIMAVGTIFGGGSRQIASTYAQVAFRAQKAATRSCLQLAQSRIVLALFYVLTAHSHQSSELMAAASGTIAFMQLTLELEDSKERHRQVFPFRMNKLCYSESRRRTVWSLFILERVNNLFPSRAALLKPDDIYIRLPTDTRSFEKQVESDMPFFDPSESQADNLKSRHLDVARILVEIVHLWSTCGSTIYGALRRPRQLKAAFANLDVLAQKLEEWHAALPKEMVFTWDNLELAESARNLGPFLTSHLLFHDAIIKLNRFKQEAGKPPMHELVPILHKACDHTKMFFELVACIERAVKTKPMLLDQLPGAFPMLAPEAVSMLVAQGPVERCDEMIESVTMTKRLIESMSHIWAESNIPAQAITSDLDALHHFRKTGTRERNPDQGYKLENDMPGFSEHKELGLQLANSPEESYQKPDVVRTRSITPL